MLQRSDIADPDYAIAVWSAFHRGKEEEYKRVMSILEDMQRRSEVVDLQVLINIYKEDRETDGTA